MDKSLTIKLKDYLNNLLETKKIISDSKVVQVSSSKEKSMVNSISEIWFESYSKDLNIYGIDDKTIDKYDSLFKKLLCLSIKSSRRSTYNDCLEKICKDFAEEIIVPLQIQKTSKKSDNYGKEILELLDRIQDDDENEYLREALGCWESNYLKAATVLIWCAAIDRIHKVIESNGFELFNQTSIAMSDAKIGRFKRFNKQYSISSISELRMVFDNDILWIIEGMGLIDSNEKNRLSSCFDMRCHSGHPGAAPITKYNVISCFSDVVEIIFSNPKFSL